MNRQQKRKAGLPTDKMLQQRMRDIKQRLWDIEGRLMVANVYEAELRVLKLANDTSIITADNTGRTNPYEENYRLAAEIKQGLINQYAAVASLLRHPIQETDNGDTDEEETTDKLPGVTKLD